MVEGICLILFDELFVGLYASRRERGLGGFEIRKEGGMAQDFSWKKRAADYVRLYRTLLKG